jgi:uncharacterized RDD family membrane protein YckC
MASRAVARPTAAVNTRPVREKVVNFSPEELAAPFLLRLAALMLDYLVLLAPPLGWLIMSRWLDEHGEMSVGRAPWIIGVVLFIVNFVLFPLLRGKTVGKALTGLTIVNMDGTYLRWEGVLRRNVLGYLVTVATFGIGFAVAAFSRKGRALHDIVGGTTVISARRDLA